MFLKILAGRGLANPVIHKVIPQSIQHLIVDKIMQGKFQRKVGIQLNICLSTVNRIWMRHKRTGRTDNRFRSSRPRITIERQKRHFCRLSMISPFSSPRQLISEAIFENHIFM